MSQALIISDTHGLKESVARIASLFPVDIAFHCGDFCVDETLFPFKNMYRVKGNNDFHSESPYEQVIDWEGLRFFMAHGHTYHVEASPLQMGYRASELEADVVLFGHTHYPFCQQEKELIFVNPGSLRKPRGFRVPTFTILDLEHHENGKSLSFTYYDEKHNVVEDLNRTFMVG